MLNSEKKDGLEEMVAEEWTLGSNEFTNGNYDNSLKHHTTAVQLLLEAYEDRKFLSNKLKEEVLASQEEIEYLRVKCSAITDSLSLLEQKTSKKTQVPGQVSDPETETEKSCLRVLRESKQQIAALDQPLQKFFDELVKKQIEYNNALQKMKHEEDRKTSTTVREVAKQTMKLEKYDAIINDLFESLCQDVDTIPNDLESRYGLLQAKISSLQERNNHLQVVEASLLAKDNQLKSKSVTIGLLEGKVEELEQVKLRLSSTIHEEEASTAKEMQVLIQQNEDLKHKYELLIDENEEQVNSNKYTEDAIAVLSGKLKARDSELEEYKRMVADLQEAKSVKDAYVEQLENNEKELLELLETADLESEKNIKSSLELQIRVKQLNEETTMKESQISKFLEQVSKLESELDSKSVTISKFKERESIYEEKLALASEKKNEFDFLTSQVASWKADVQASIKLTDIVEELLSETQTRTLGELKKKFLALQEKLHSSTAMLQQQQDEVEKSHQSRIEYNKLEQEVNLKNLEIKDLRLKVSQLEKLVYNLGKEKDDLKEDMTSARKSIKREQEDNKNILDRLNYKDFLLNGKEREITEINSTVEELRIQVASVDNYRVELTEKDIMVSELKQKLSSQQSTISTLVSVLREASTKVLNKDKLLDMTTSIMSTLESVESLEQAIADQAKHNADIAVIQKQYQEEVIGLRNKVAAADEENMLLSDQITRAHQSAIANVEESKNDLIQANSLQEGIVMEIRKLEKSQRLKNIRERKLRLLQFRKVKELGGNISSALQIVGRTEDKLVELVNNTDSLVPQAKYVEASAQASILEIERNKSLEKLSRMEIELGEYKAKVERFNGEKKTIKEHLTTLEETIVGLKQEKREILEDVGTYYSFGLPHTENQKNIALIEKLKASVEMLDQALADTKYIGQENQRLKEEVQGLKSCKLLRYHLDEVDVESASDASTSEYLDDSSFTDEEASLVALETSQELENPPDIKESSGSTVVVSTLPASNVHALDSPRNDERVAALLEILDKHEFDINLLRQQLSNLSYNNVRETSISSPLSLGGILKNTVAPNVLVILIAFFSALKDTRF